jgi:hypothetical protein
MKLFALLLPASLFLTSCSENYANGERIGLVTQFSRSGVINKSWEGHLNLTQTGMNSSSAEPFDFSIDNEHEDENVINQIDSAANLGWKVKLTYHETFGKNWFKNRGETDHFITGVTVLDRNPVGHIFGTSGVHDTIYLVIFKNRPL